MSQQYNQLRKLCAFGLCGTLPCFMQILIFDRTFAVKLFSDNATFSGIFVQANEVPQENIVTNIIDYD